MAFGSRPVSPFLNCSYAQWGAGPFPTWLARFEIDRWPLLVSLSELGFGLLVTP
jgi:hypothetical protein